MESNINTKVVNDFGNEWKAFDQQQVPEQELEYFFKLYFTLFPWGTLPKDAQGFDLGCGSGRWAKFVAPRVKILHCIDPAVEALRVAHRNLSAFNNCIFHCASVDDIPLDDSSMDFGYSLGVLHHVPDTQKGISECVKKLKTGAPFLVYLYYAFDNRALWFRWIWKASDLLRRIVCRLPFILKLAVSQALASTLYFPLAKISKVVEKRGYKVDSIPLSGYRHKSFYSMRTDALDRFGTRVEKRFTKTDIERMMQRAGLKEVRVGDSFPYWCAVGFKR